MQIVEDLIKRANRLIDSQIAVRHPELGLQGAYLREPDDWCVETPEYKDASNLAKRFLVEATRLTINQLIEIFQLPRLHEICYPEIVYSDPKLSQDAFRDGMDSGYYEIGSSCFIANGASNRDYRVRYTPGPIIMYLGKPNLETV